ncbi:MAG: hypothetical protein KGM24_10015 [Elusimicrobia bacterium]|nr:hypothetical protein [Elusimicrobiota bacterium]
MRTSLALLAALFLLPGLASAQAWRSYFPGAGASASGAASACPKIPPVAIGNTQAYADDLGDGTCFVSIHPMNADMVYRDYAVFSDGMLMVFSSYGAGEGPDMTSARSFYFFPRRGLPRLETDKAAGTVRVVMADGGVATFDPATAQIAGLDRGAVTVSPRIARDDDGGVEIPEYRGLMLDAGFRLGELPAGRPNAASTFRSAEGQTCTVTNSEIFAYKSGNPVLKFDDAGLSAFLKTRCPGLNVGF